MSWDFTLCHDTEGATTVIGNADEIHAAMESIFTSVERLSKTQWLLWLEGDVLEAVISYSKEGVTKIAISLSPSIDTLRALESLCFKLQCHAYDWSESTSKPVDFKRYKEIFFPSASNSQGQAGPPQDLAP